MTRVELLERAQALGVSRNSFALEDEPIREWNVSDLGSRWSVWFDDSGRARTDEEYFETREEAYEHLFTRLLQGAASGGHVTFGDAD